MCFPSATGAQRGQDARQGGQRGLRAPARQGLTLGAPTHLPQGTSAPERGGGLSPVSVSVCLSVHL